MSLVAAFLLSAAVQAAPVDAPRDNDRGAQVESARIAVTILRPAVLKGGTLASAGDNAPRSQRRSDGASITYAFE
jgi:hypothetical protein